MDYSEEIDMETEVVETLMLGFRLNEGINKKAFQNRFGFSLHERYGDQSWSLRTRAC